MKELRGEAVGTTISSPSFSRVPILIDPKINIRFGEPVYIEREGETWGYVGRIVSASEQNGDIQGKGSADDAGGVVKRHAEAELLEEVRSENGKLSFGSPQTVPLIGVKVFRLGMDMVTQTYGFDKTNPLLIGNEHLTGHEVKLAPEFLSRHITILGRPGTGKSYTTGVILEECVRHKVPVVVIDITGEAREATEELGGIVMKPGHEEFTIRLAHLTSHEVTELAPNLEPDERELVVDTMEKLQQTMKDEWTLHDLLNEIQKAGDAMRMAVIADRVRRRLNHSIRSRNFIGPGVKWTELFTKYPVITIFAGEMPKKHAALAVAAVCRGLMRMRQNGSCPPFAFVLDEAHRFVPRESQEVSSDVIANFLRIGRHICVGTVIISQSPSTIDRELLMLANTRIIHALDGNDLGAVSGLLGDAPGELVDRIPTLAVGTAVLCGAHEIVRHTCVIKIRKRNTTHAAVTPDLIQEADNWRQRNSKGDKSAASKSEPGKRLFR